MGRGREMGKIKKIGIAGWVIGLFLILVPSMASADLGDILPGLQIYGTVQETYDNNVNLTPTNKKDDFITSVGLGLRYSTLPKSEITGEFRKPSVSEETKYGVFLDFLPTYVFYAKSTNDDYLSLLGNLDTWYTWDRKLTLRFKDYLTRSEEPLEQNFAATALPNQVFVGSQRGRSIYIRNVAQPSLEYRFGKEDIVSINYMSNVYRNDNNTLFEDSTENYINPKLTYWFDIKNGISLEYGLDLGDFQRSPDMTGNLAKGRYTYRFNPRTSIFAEYTFQSREFEKQVSISTLDYNVHAPSVGFEHAFSPTLSLRAQFGYFLQTPKKGSNESGPLYDVVITQRAQKTTYTLGFQGGYIEDYFTAENLGFAKYHQVIGTITHQLTQRAFVTLSGRYQRPKFNDGRVDNIYGVGVAGSYRILKWLTVAIDFSYAGDHSNRETSEYSDFRGMVRVTAAY